MSDDVSTSTEDILAWCCEYLADLLAMPLEKVDSDADFDRLGVDSAVAVSLLMEVEDRYGVDIPPEALFENPNLRAVAEYLHTHRDQNAA